MVSLHSITDMLDWICFFLLQYMASYFWKCFYKRRTISNNWSWEGSWGVHSENAKEEKMFIVVYVTICTSDGVSYE